MKEKTAGINRSVAAQTIHIEMQYRIYIRFTKYLATMSTGTQSVRKTNTSLHNFHFYLRNLHIENN